MGERIGLFDACAQGVMCPIDRRVIDDPTSRGTLEKISCGGFVTAEQMRDPRIVDGGLADVTASRD